MFKTGKFDHPEIHHEGWFRIFVFDVGAEIWFGRRWIMIGI